MNVNLLVTMDYENKSNWTLGESKPKQTQFQIGRQKRKNGTFYAAHPTYIKELCERAVSKYMMNCLS